jgi:hypothetical protein
MEYLFHIKLKKRNMKIISTKVHGYLDYAMGMLLIVSPWLFDFYRGGAETWVPIVLGISTIVYSLMTDYELGITRMISMKTHLILDAMSAVFLIASPWLFNFDEIVSTPHVVFGVLELLAVAMTTTIPVTSRREHTRHAH